MDSRTKDGRRLYDVGTFGRVLFSVAASLQPTAVRNRRRAPSSGPNPTGLNRSKHHMPTLTYKNARDQRAVAEAHRKEAERIAREET